MVAGMRTHGLRFDVNCSMLFTELPLLERAAAAKAAGFDAVEFWWPFDQPVPGDHEVDAFVRSINDAGVTLAALNFAAGDLAAGDRGLLSSRSGSPRFQENLDVCADIARRTGCHVLNALYGNRTDDTDTALAITNITIAAQVAWPVGATVVVEALNSFDCPDYPLTSSALVFALLDSVPISNVALLADLYHLARMGEDLPSLLAARLPRIGHIQIADVPRRGAPGTGDLDYQPIFDRLSDLGYNGWIGLEYLPADPDDSSTSFGWLAPDQRHDHG
jgi:hydroxypyruvate isomerase